MHDFTDYYQKYFDYVYRYLALRVQDKQATEDLTSRTFLAAFEKQAHYDPEKGSWKQWITGIAKNCLLQYWSNQKVEISLEEMNPADLLNPSSTHSMEIVDQQMQFKKILQNAPSSMRQLLVLKYVDDLTYESIAQITQKTPQAIRKAFSRLHKNLSEQLNPNDFIS